MKTIDLNADVGEGIMTDGELLEIVSSANICCGSHAGSPGTAMRTIIASCMKGVTIGAHPGFADRANFGRVEMELDNIELMGELLLQIGGLILIGQASMAPVRYIKPHGALYNMACRPGYLAGAISSVARLVKLPVLALPTSQLETACLTDEVPFFREGFADRRYDGSGKLVPRDRPNAFIEDPSEAVEQVHRLIEDHGVQSICIHGDNPDAVRFARTVRAKLEAAGYQIKPFA